MNNSNYYRAFGLIFQSDLKLPEMEVSCPVTQPDVKITLGSTPDKLENSASAGSICQAKSGEFLLKMPDIGKFYVQKGLRIIVEPEAYVEEDDLRIFLLGSSMGALLHQRGNLALHASAVVVNDRAVLLAGPSGAGKSTLACALVKRGYKFLADDITAITLNEDNTPLAHPGLTRAKLWRDSARTLEYEPEKLALVRSGTTNRFAVKAEIRAAGPVPVSGIFCLAHSNQDEFQIDTKPMTESFVSVLANTYRVRYLDGLEARAAHFATASQIVKNVPIHEITRPDQPFRIDELIDLVLDLSSCKA